MICGQLVDCLRDGENVLERGIVVCWNFTTFGASATVQLKDGTFHSFGIQRLQFVGTPPVWH